MGTVYDSVARTPLSGALVQMRLQSGTSRVVSATTDSAGTYRIANVPRGRYLATFFHPVLESLGVMPIMWRVDVKDSVTRATFAVPSPATIWAASCSRPNANDSTGLVLGHVHDADTGVPLGGSVVSATWSEIDIDQHGIHNERRQLAATANDDGLYALCGVPTDANVQMRAQHGTTASGVVEIAAQFHGLTQRDFGIGSSDSMTTVTAADADSSAARSGDGTLVRRGTARLEGTIHGPGGGALSDVELAIVGSDVRGHTDGRGHFTLADLPPGTYTLEARHLGFAPKRAVVDLSSHRTTMIDVTLDKQVAVLNTVHVYGKRTTRSPNLDGFLFRRRMGFGHFLTRQDIEKQHPFFLTDALRMVPGVQVSTSGLSHSIVMRGDHACHPATYVDGMRVYGDVDDVIDPEDVDAMEVYTGPGQAPPQFMGKGCGSLVIWTHLAP
jgi:hypothetical protein